jgi:hypothetical protein
MDLRVVVFQFVALLFAGAAGGRGIPDRLLGGEIAQRGQYFRFPADLSGVSRARASAAPGFISGRAGRAGDAGCFRFGGSRAVAVISRC